MRKLTWSCIILSMLFCTSGRAQSVDSARSFFPLEVGNLWEYTEIWLGFSNLFTIAVDRDTVLPNSKVYKQLTRKQLPTGNIQVSFMRIDSTDANLYAFDSSAIGDDRLIDTLLLNVGARSLRYGPLVKFDTATVLGFTTLVQHFWQGTGGNSYSVAYGIGLCDAQEVGLYEYWDVTHLVYARISGKEYGTLQSVKSDNPSIPGNLDLMQNYPNPFNPTTEISFSLPNRAMVSLQVFDLLGRQVASPINKTMNPGSHTILFNANELSSGVYFYRLTSGGRSYWKKMLLLR